MAKLKLGSIENSKPVKITVALPAQVYGNLVAYAEALSRERGTAAIEPAQLVAPMLDRFMSTDRGFTKLRRSVQSETSRGQGSESV